MARIRSRPPRLSPPQRRDRPRSKHPAKAPTSTRTPGPLAVTPRPRSRCCPPGGRSRVDLVPEGYGRALDTTVAWPANGHSLLEHPIRCILVATRWPIRGQTLAPAPKLVLAVASCCPHRGHSMPPLFLAVLPVTTRWPRMGRELAHLESPGQRMASRGPSSGRDVATVFAGGREVGSDGASGDHLMLPEGPAPDHSVATRGSRRGPLNGLLGGGSETRDRGCHGPLCGLGVAACGDDRGFVPSEAGDPVRGRRPWSLSPRA